MEWLETVDMEVVTQDRSGPRPRVQLNMHEVNFIKFLLLAPSTVTSNLVETKKCPRDSDFH